MRTQSRPLAGIPPAEPPPVDVIDGRRAAWQGWKPYGFPGRHMAPCSRCGYDQTQWINYGQVEPLPGEQVEEIYAVSWRAEPVTGVRRRLVPAVATLRLVGHQCPACHHRRVYDTKGGWAEVTMDLAAEQLELFPAQRKVSHA